MGSGMNYEHKATPLQAWCDALELGDSKRLLRKMDSIYNNLKMEIAA